MSILSKLKTTEKVEEEKDILGGKKLFPSSAKDFTIKLAYFHETKKGSIAFALTAVAVDGSGEFRTIQYTTSGHEKGQSPTYTNDNGTFYLPGYNIANAVCALAAGTEIGEDLVLEEKTIGVYDPDQKKEVPTQVDVAVDLIGEKITLGILHKIENKNDRNPQTGKYDVVTNEKREYNELDRVFHEETKVTLVEAKKGMEEPDFYNKWMEKYDGKVQDTYKPVEGGANTGAAPSGGAPSGAAPKKKLFGNKK